MTRCKIAYHLIFTRVQKSLMDFLITNFFSDRMVCHSMFKKKINAKSVFVQPLQPHKGPAQPYAVKPKVFEIEGSNLVSKPLKGKGAAWWRLPKCKVPKTPPCAAPKDPQNSPKTAPKP